MKAPPVPARPDPRAFALLGGVVTVVALLGLLPLGAGTPHHAALPPLGLFADIRLLLARSPSYAVFVPGLVVVLAARTLFLAAALGSLDRGTLRWCAGFHALAVLPALLAAVLGFTATHVLYVGFLWAGAAINVATSLGLGDRPWNRGLGRPTAVGVLAGNFIVLLVVSMLAAVGDLVVQLTAIWIAAGASFGIARLLAGAPWSPRAGVALTSAVLLAVPLAVVASDVPTPRQAGDHDRSGSLMVVPGVGGSSGTATMFELDPSALGYTCDRTWYFSYAGPGGGAPQRDAACPIRTGAPYEEADTRRPLDELASAFGRQLEGLPAPVVVVAHSQGGWITTAAVARRVAPADQIDAIVLLGGFASGNPGYQLEGTGDGAVGTDALEALLHLLRTVDVTSFDPGGPLARDVLAPRGAVRGLVADAVRGGTEVVTIRSAFDLPLTPPHAVDPATEVRCPVYVHHSDLPTNAAAMQQIRDALDGRGSGRSCPWWRRWPMRALAAFGAR